MTSVLPQPDPPLLDAYDGGREVAGPVNERYSGWTIAPSGLPVGKDLWPRDIDQRNPLDPAVGWGLVLSEIPGASAAVQATAEDAPPELRRLLAHRRGKVLRYRPNDAASLSVLSDPAADADIALISPRMGVGAQELPKYLLIYGDPVTIPWQLQFNLNPIRCVGRLDLTGEPLARYVEAELQDWAGAAADCRAPVVWSVDTGGGLQRDMTTLMRRTVGLPLQKAFADDPDLDGLVYLDGSRQPALIGGLVDALASRRPALVVTTSHGLTAPTDDPAALRARLGTPVDQLYQPLDPAAMLQAWQPDGAIWFAQACCSAGGNGPSVYHGLFPVAGDVGSVLFGVAGLGAAIAPLPRALLGAEKPLRAFVGRVEPTFSWSLRDQLTGAALTSDLVEAIYRRLFLGYPVGMALEPFFAPISAILQQYLQATGRYNDDAGPAGAAAVARALYLKVTALDRGGLVVLGDPAVRLPLPAAPGAGG